MKPFSGIYYSKKNREKISALAAPDLDSVQNIWGELDSPLAFRNILVGEPERRGEIWQAWISAGELEQGKHDAYYILKHDFEFEGRMHERWALIGSIDIDSPRLFIHEDVIPEGVERARRSMECCEGDLAPIFVGCSEKIEAKLHTLLPNAVKGQKTLLEYAESASAHHTVWEVSNPQSIAKISQYFENENLFLLDGHHRLAAAKRNVKNGIGDGKIMALVCSMGQDDTLILPIHRVVCFEPWILPEKVFSDFSKFDCKWTARPDWRPADIFQHVARLGFNQRECVVLHAHANRLMSLSFPQSGLVVEQLEKVLANFPKARVIPVPDPRLALEQLALDQVQVGFFLPAIGPETVQKIALNGEKLPRKSTRFMPKPALGLVSRPWA